MSDLLQTIIDEATLLAENRILLPHASDHEITTAVSECSGITIHPNSCGALEVVNAYRKVERMVLAS